jgi:hypothetical protein
MDCMDDAGRVQNKYELEMLKKEKRLVRVFLLL